ncbi:DUF2384 domain-containing protein [bacterium]|nr:DUF2384 domain-containing protein [bacterium]
MASLAVSKSVKDLRSAMGCTIRIFALISGISERNLIRWEKQSVKPNSKSRKVIEKIEELYGILADIFDGDQNKISKWLNTPNKSLDGRTPFKQIISAPTEEQGIEQIIDLLNGFKLGVVS